MRADPKEPPMLLPQALHDLIVQSVATAIWKRPEVAPLREPIEQVLKADAFAQLVQNAFEAFAERSTTTLPQFFDEGFLRMPAVLEHLSAYIVEGKAVDMERLAELYSKRHLDPSAAPDVRAPLEGYLRQMRETLAAHPTFGPVLLARDVQSMAASLNNLRGDMHNRFDEVIQRFDALLKEPEIKSLVERKTGTHVFLSYSRHNLSQALHIRQRLENTGHTVWQDTTAIKGGADWIRSIEDGIERAYAVVSVVSHEASQSEWVQIEFLHAKRRNKRILPIKIDDCEIPTLMLLTNVHHGHPDFEAGLRALLTDLGTPAAVETPGREPNQRDLEIAYLDKLLLEHSVWQTVYTPMAGVGQLQVESEDDLEVVTTGAEIETLFSAFIEEHLPTSTQKRVEERQYGDILDAVAELRQLVILGDPGSGKTTTLWRITADLAEKAKQNPNMPIPVFLRLSEFKGGETLEQRIQTQLGALAPHYAELKDENRLALLFDGLNELPDAGRNETIRQIKTLITHCQQRDLIAAVTCRELDYVGVLDMGISERVVVQPLDPVRIRRFVNAYIKKPAGKGDALFWEIAGEEAHTQWQAFVQAVGEDEQTFWLADELPTDKTWGWSSDRDVYFKWWKQQRRQPRSLLTLATNPYMLYMLTQVSTKTRRIPENRGVLFAQFVDFLLLKREKLKAAEADDLKQRLSELAFTMQRSGEGTSVREADVLATLGSAEHLYRARSANLLTGSDPVRFTHQLLQEYFAARSLDRELRAETPASAFWQPDNWWQANVWNETAILLTGLYNNDATPVIEWLRDANPELTARCILESGASTPDETLQALRPLWLPRLTDTEREPHPEARAAVGRALGVLNLDDRPGVGLKAGMPDIAWSEVIPAGAFTFDEGDEAQQLTIDYPYWIARYPVTVAQFGAFVEAKEHGYLNKAYWTEAGWAWRGEKTHPEVYWNDPQWHISNHPVVGVTWYEAYAFTRWLNERLHTAWAQLAPHGASESYVVRLLTEAEWEKAARYPDGRRYPWGEQYISGYANVDETENKVGEYYLRRTSAVGLYPQGVNPLIDAYDLSGNVDEWCLTKWANAYQHPGDNDAAGTDRRCLRGGSWFGAVDYARAALRNWYDPDDGYLDGGFRVCVSSPIFSP